MSRDVALDYRWALHCLEHIEELVVVTDAAIGSAGEGGPYVRYVNAALERSTARRAAVLRARLVGRTAFRPQRRLLSSPIFGLPSGVGAGAVRSSPRLLIVLSGFLA